MVMEQGGSGRVGHTEFQKQKGSRIEWVLSKGLGMNSGHGEVWIGVPVRCYTPCNTWHHLLDWDKEGVVSLKSLYHYVHTL